MNFSTIIHNCRWRLFKPFPAMVLLLNYSCMPVNFNNSSYKLLTVLYTTAFNKNCSLVCVTQCNKISKIRQRRKGFLRVLINEVKLCNRLKGGCEYERVLLVKIKRNVKISFNTYCKLIELYFTERLSSWLSKHEKQRTKPHLTVLKILTTTCRNEICKGFMSELVTEIQRY